jgi:hypothetical protein
MSTFDVNQDCPISKKVPLYKPDATKERETKNERPETRNNLKHSNQINKPVTTLENPKPQTPNPKLSPGLVFRPHIIYFVLSLITHKKTNGTNY